MLISLLKQKQGTDNVSEWVEFDPATNSISGAEIKHVNLETVP